MSTVHVVLGTKAQYLKMTPVVRRLCEKGCEVHIIDTVQHGSLREHVVPFEIARTTITRLLEQDTLASRPQSFAIWLGRSVLAIVRMRLCGPARAGMRPGDVVLIHGDTASTALGLLIGKLFKLPVFHVESGLSSGRLLEPFPEELIRRVSLRYSDVCYVPDSNASDFAVTRYPGKQIVCTDGNTIVDTLRMAAELPIPESVIPTHPYALCTVHRFETVWSRRMLRRLLAIMQRVGRTVPVVFVLHPVTEHSLEKFHLLPQLRQSPNVRILPLVPYHHFVQLLNNCRFVMTDGGSVQEEAAAIGVPCLILRHRTERRDGLGANAILSRFALTQVDRFLTSYRQLDRRSGCGDSGHCPSQVIVDDVCSRMTRSANREGKNPRRDNRPRGQTPRPSNEVSNR